MKQKTMNTIIGILLVILACMTGFLLYTFVIKPANVVVPDFIGRNVEEVYAWCGELDENHACEVSYEDTENYDRDVVFEQSLAGGSKFKKGTVSFKISTGEWGEIVLPFIGPDTNKSDIEAWAMTFGITNITYVEETSDTVTKNHVIRIEPNKDIRKDTPITV